MASPVTARPFLHHRFRGLDTPSVGRPPPIPRERLAYLTRRIHSLGERPLYEFLCEIDAGAPLHRTLERYSELWVLRGFIKANDGDRLQPPRVATGCRS
jgi:hypothetical protein